jgi:hypothetical protein
VVVALFLHQEHLQVLLFQLSMEELFHQLVEEKAEQTTQVVLQVYQEILVDLAEEVQEMLNKAAVLVVLELLVVVLRVVLELQNQDKTLLEVVAVEKML